MTHHDGSNSNQGPLRFPSLVPPTIESARALRSLAGHSTSALWLAEGLHPELDEIRAEHLRIRSQCAAEIEALDALDDRFREEDKLHEQELLQAQRAGTPEAVEDKRTSPDQRQTERSAVEERLFSGVIVLAEVADKAVEWVREHESDLLAERIGRLAPLVEEEREARQAVVRARSKMWELAQYGPYIKRLADDGAFGRQPVPVPAEPPAQFDVDQARRMLERHWSEPKPGIGDDGQPIRSWIEDDDDLEPVGTEDETGTVSALVETEGVAS